MPDAPRELQQQCEQLRKWLGGAGDGRPPRDRMREAVNDFRQTGQFASLADARLACFGAVEHFLETQKPLIEEREAFPRLLNEVDRFSREPRAYRRCYRGLLHSYFSYDPGLNRDEEGARNWRRLQEYLGARVQNIHVDGMQPEWVSAIQDHRNLVSDNPVERYGADMLRGDNTAFEEARVKLEIDSDSWVLRQLVLAQVKASTNQTDPIFKQHLVPLLEILDEYPLQKDEGLALLLDRYVAMQSRPEHASLRDASIAAWGRPWMTINDVRWQRVRPEARSMVHGWLNLKLIQQFFDVLSEDHNTDQRRVRFWEKYHGQIEEIYFALGRSAKYSRSADVRQLKKNMGSHLLWLRGGGSANNAFIMRVGRYLIVEFGLSGNACFIFDADNLPFHLSGELAADSTALKHVSHRHRLLHVDRAYETWEDDFQQTLSNLGIRPGVSAPNPRRPTGRPVESVPFSLDAVIVLARRHGFSVQDLRRSGGRLWVVGPEKEGVVAQQLLAWKFKWASRRRAWYRADATR